MTLSVSSTAVKAASASMCGQTAVRPLPFISTDRVIMPKCRIGLSTVSGCIHCGIASTGVSAPESEASGGLTKKAINCACCADFVNVRDERTDADARQHAQHRAHQYQHEAAAERHAEDHFDQRGREQNRDAEQQKDRRDLRHDDFPRARRRHQKLLDRAGFALFYQRGRRDDRAVQHQQHAQRPGHDEPRRHEPRVEQKRRMHQDMPLPAHLIGRYGPILSVHATLLRVNLAPVLEYACRIPLRDGGRVGVHRVQQYLNVGLPAALHVARKVVGDHQARVQVAARQRLSELILRKVRVGQAKRAALGHVGDQIAALGRVIEIEHAHPQVIDRGVQREAKQQQLDRGRHDERCQQALIPPDLPEFLFNQCDKSIHMLSCILRSFFQPSA